MSNGRKRYLIDLLDPREAYGKGELNDLGWKSAKYNIANGQTKMKLKFSILMW